MKKHPKTTVRQVGDLTPDEQQAFADWSREVLIAAIHRQRNAAIRAERDRIESSGPPEDDGC